MRKPSATNNRPPAPSRKPGDRARFVRAAVVEALGDATAFGLPAKYYVRRGDIMRSYGFSSRQVSKLVTGGVLEEKHFVYE